MQTEMVNIFFFNCNSGDTELHTAYYILYYYVDSYMLVTYITRDINFFINLSNLILSNTVAKCEELISC